MSVDDAVAADREERIEEAAELYELAIAASAAPLSVLMNLAILYWQATDYGFSSGHHLAQQFVARAAIRFGELLNEGATRFPQNTEPRFWQKYIAWADLGTPLSSNECRSLLAQDPSALVVSMHLFSVSQGAECVDEAFRLLEASRADRTTRSRYIASVIEGALKRRTGNSKN